MHLLWHYFTDHRTGFGPLVSVRELRFPGKLRALFPWIQACLVLIFIMAEASGDVKKTVQFEPLAAIVLGICHLRLRLGFLRCHRASSQCLPFYQITYHHTKSLLYCFR